MSTREAGSPSPLVTGKADLVAWIASGAKPRPGWLIGTEHEKFLFTTEGHRPVPYGGPRGIKAVMDALIARYGWQPIKEGETTIALKHANGGSVSLEPGGQFELSGAALPTVHGVAAETAQHIAEVRAIGRDLGIGMLGLGHTPSWSRADMPTMPKRRYAVMTKYMPKVGSRGLDMMYRTCTIQVNLDFADEADMVKKLRVSLALQPIATALFAASPFVEGKPSGQLSTRSEIWRDTDNRRTGMLPFAFEAGMGYERYVDYALDVPMYFVYRDGNYIDVAGASFRAFMAGKLPALPGERPTIDDWSDHMTTLFPEVRVKRYMEMRGADCGPVAHITALPAFWVGLLYDSAALDAAYDLVKDWTAQERQALRDRVPATALATPFRKTTVQDIARQAVALSKRGLAARAMKDASGQDETRYLTPIEAIAASGRTVADHCLAQYRHAWKQQVDPIFTEFAY
jgi:glutamate--cysteine ligase